MKKRSDCLVWVFRFLSAGTFARKSWLSVQSSWMVAIRQPREPFDRPTCRQRIASAEWDMVSMSDKVPPIQLDSHWLRVLLRLAAQSFPTPMEEPKKVLRAQYLGCCEVQQAVGMNTINDAIEKVSAEAAPDNWTNVNVSISPSMIAVRPNGVCCNTKRCSPMVLILPFFHPFRTMTK